MFYLYLWLIQNIHNGGRYKATETINNNNPNNMKNVLLSKDEYVDKDELLDKDNIEKINYYKNKAIMNRVLYLIL